MTDRTDNVPAGNAPGQQHPHAAICIRFELEGVEYEAVGFLREGESDVKLTEALNRCGPGVVSSEEDWNRIARNRHLIPQELRQFGWLFTARPNDPNWLFHALGLYRTEEGWYLHAHAFHYRCYGYTYGLVLRRRS